MLILRKISKSFPQRGIVLNNLDLNVSDGEMIAVTGPSGSGKTTLLNLIGLLDTPDSGEIIFRGKHLNSYSNDEAARFRNMDIGFIFQEHLLLPYLTIIENIVLPLSARNLSGNEYQAAKEHAFDLMKKIGIDNIGEKYPYNVSGGEAQRAALVRALINKPSLLLADEPTGSLDAANSEKLGELLREMSKLYGTAVILATHSPSLAKKMSVVYAIRNGKLEQI